MKRLVHVLPRGEAVLPLLLIALLVLMFVAWPLAEIGVIERPLVGMLLVIVFLCALLTLGGSGRFAVPTIVLGLLLFALQMIATTAPSLLLSVAAEGVACLFLLLLCTVLLIGVFAPGRISVNRIIGGVVVYLLIAVLFSLLFDIVERFTPHAVNVGSASAAPAAAPGGARFFYLSVITLSSVGFGDVAPVHPIARSLVMVEALLGQIYTTVLLARLVSLETVQRDRGPPRQ